MPEPVLVIACGALAREIHALREANGWRHVRLTCLPAELHATPARIAGRLDECLRRHRAEYRSIFVAYADCGTYGAIDAVLAEHGVARLPGEHCYATFAGADRFAGLCADEPGTFFLTDFLARHFDRFVMGVLGIDRHPELRDAYFANYERLVYLSQVDDPSLFERARRAAQELGLRFEHRHTGLAGLARELAPRLTA